MESKGGKSNKAFKEALLENPEIKQEYQSLATSYSKEKQLQAGTPPERRKKINSRAKGQRGEREAIDMFCEKLGREKCATDKRNNQATVWGGASNADISIRGLEKLHMEVKNTSVFQFPAWTKKLLEECPEDKIPVLLYKEARRGFWMIFRADDLDVICQEWLEAKGFMVSGYERGGGNA